MNQQSIPHDAIDVAVVGGGLAGLVTGITAAQQGASVAVLDGRTFGGRARSVNRDGYTLNEGGHALYRTGGGFEVLTGLGVRPVGSEPSLDGYHTIWNGTIARLPVAPKSILTSRLLSTRSKVKLGRWFGDIAGLAATAGDVTLDEWLTAQRAGGDLRRFMSMMCRLSTYSARPGEMPARAMLGQLAAAGGGVLYLDGGWQSLVDQLVAIARGAGVTLVDHATVTAIAGEADRWSLATRDDVMSAGAVVVAAGGPAVAAGLLGDDPAGWVERAGPPQRAACLDVGGTTDALQFLLSADEPLYCSQHAPFAHLAPDGASLYSLMRYLHPDDPATSDENRAALDAHAARAGLPAPQDRAVNRFLGALTVSWGSPQVGTDRPSGDELAGRGLFVAGDWVGDKLLADASLVSGSNAGRAAAARALTAARC